MLSLPFALSSNAPLFLLPFLPLTLFLLSFLLVYIIPFRKQATEPHKGKVYKQQQLMHRNVHCDPDIACKCSHWEAEREKGEKEKEKQETHALIPLPSLPQFIQPPALWEEREAGLE